MEITLVTENVPVTEVLYRKYFSIMQLLAYIAHSKGDYLIF